MLEEELRVSPLRRGRLRATHHVADKAAFSAKLRRLIEAEDLEHGGVGGNCRELVQEVVLIVVCPAVHIVGLNLYLEWPVEVLDLVAVLVELRQLHHGHGAHVVGHFVQVPSNAL